MLSSIHILLTYACTCTCPHCFVYGSPNAKGTFTLAQIRQLLKQAKAVPNIEVIYFEGGEPGLYYSLLNESIRLAAGMGFSTGIVTNAYWATAEEDALHWLAPLMEAGLSGIDISDDDLHFGEGSAPAVRYALAAAARLGLPASALRRSKPYVELAEDGSTTISGGVKFRGRAVDMLAEGLPGKPWQEFTCCPHETLDAPARVHIDPYGNVFLCQGISLGNIRTLPLSALLNTYQPASHPIAGPLAYGGPAALTKLYGISPQGTYLDACHLCFLTRRQLLDRFPQYLAPRQVYGEEAAEPAVVR